MQSAFKSTDDDLPLLDKKIAIAWDKKKLQKLWFLCSHVIKKSWIALSKTDASSEATTELSNTD